MLYLNYRGGKMTEMELFKKALMQRKQNQNEIAKKSGIKDAILHELEQIEQKLDVEILHCVDFGKNDKMIKRVAERVRLSR